MAISNGGDSTAITPKGKKFDFCIPEMVLLVPSPNIPPSSTGKKDCICKQTTHALHSIRKMSLAYLIFAHPLKQVKEPMVKIFFRSIVILLKCGNLGEPRSMQYFRHMKKIAPSSILSRKISMKSPGQSKNLHPYSTIDPATGNILEPVKSSCYYERDMYGNEN